jgi:hypothetical protein
MGNNYILVNVHYNDHRKDRLSKKLDNSEPGKTDHILCFPELEIS